MSFALYELGEAMQKYLETFRVDGLRATMSYPPVKAQSAGYDVTTQAGVSVQCECPGCLARREKTKGLAAILGSILSDAGDADPEEGGPVVLLPAKWLTNLKPDTDTAEQRAAFLKKNGLACPTEITPDDIEDINRGLMW